MPVLKNTWMKQSGNRLTTSRRRNSVTPFKEYLNMADANKPNSNFPRDFVFYADLWHSEQQGFGTLANGTGIATPTALVAGANTVTVATEGTFTIWLPSIHTGTAASGTAVVTGSPVSLVGGNNTITVTGTGTITITCTDQVVDRSPNAALCPTTGSPTWSNQGRTFDGATGKILIPDSATIQNLAVGAATIAAWIKHSDASTDYDGFIGTDLNTNGRGLLLEMAGAATSIGFLMRNTIGTSFFPTVTYTDNTWTFFAGTFDLSQLILWKNGAAVGSPTAFTGSRAAAATVTAGFAGVDSNRFFGGLIGEGWMYNRALSATEILQTYNGTKWRYV